MSVKLCVMIFLLAVVSGCTAVEKKENIEEVVMKNISISAEAFREGDTIPAEYTCSGADVSPALSWTGVPAGTKSIALIMDDPDARGTFIHWVLFNIPPETQKLPGAVPRNKTLSDGSRNGVNDFGDIGYGGPCPPPGKPHRYYFRLYALDIMLELQPGATRKQVDDAMKGHVLAKGELMGRYGR